MFVDGSDAVNGVPLIALLGPLLAAFELSGFALPVEPAPARLFGNHRSEAPDIAAA
jgi:hypothetical protein